MKLLAKLLSLVTGNPTTTFIVIAALALGGYMTVIKNQRDNAREDLVHAKTKIELREVQLHEVRMDSTRLAGQLIILNGAIKKWKQEARDDSVAHAERIKIALGKINALENDLANIDVSGDSTALQLGF